MSTNKVASVGLVLKPQGFLSGIRNAKGQFVKDVGAMKSATTGLGAALDRQAKAAKDVSKALAAPPTGGGFLGWLRRTESQAKDTAKRIGKYFSDALSAWNLPDKGGGGSRGRGGAGGGSFSAGALIAYDQMKKLASYATDAVREVSGTNDRARSLSVNARKGGGGYISPAVLEAQAYATASDVKGTTADQALEAMSAFVTLTGDIKTAQSSITTFATASKASGADMKDVAEATASISKQFQIVDPKQIQDVLAAMIYQGKEGAIMLPEMAAGLQKIAAAGAAFGVSKDVTGVRKLGGLVQMARGGTGSPEQAFTAVEAVFRGLTEKEKELKAAHVSVYEGRGAKKHTRSIDDILVDVVSKAGGKDIGKKNAAIASIFGSEGMRAFSPMVGIYQSAFAGAKGEGGAQATDAERTAAGVAALRKALGDLTNAAGTWGDVQDDAAKNQAATSAKVTAAWENLKSKVASDVLPALGRVVDKFDDVDGGADTFVTMLEETAEALGAFIDVLKPIMLSLGIIKNPNKDLNFDLAKKYKGEADRADEQLQGMQMSPEAIAKLAKSDPEELKRRREKAGELTSKRDAARAMELKYATDAAEKDQVPDFVLKQAFPERYEGEKKGTVARKIEDQKRAAAGQAPADYGAAPGAAAGPKGTPGSPSTVKLDGGVKISGQNGPLRVHISGDDTKRNAGPGAPARGTTSRG